MHTCEKCGKVTGWLLLILGVLFLLKDLKVFGFWDINWYSALFVVLGICAIASSNCGDCRAVRMGKKK